MMPETLTPPASPAVMLTESMAAPRVTLSRVGDRLHASINRAQAVPVRLLRARPLSDPDGLLVLMDDRKKCLFEIPSLRDLDASSRVIAIEELSRRYCIANISQVEWTLVDFGNRYWAVITDRGRRTFLLRDPQRNISRPHPDQLMIRDVLGNRYCILSIAALDPESRLAMEAAI
jgi:hypothetical protein